MTRAERAALEAYPPDVVKTMYGEFDANAVQRTCFWRGYMKALEELKHEGAGIVEAGGGQNL